MSDETDLWAVYDRLGAERTSVDGHDIPGRFARPMRAHEAVRNAVGVTEHAYGVVAVTGADRQEFLDNTITCRVPERADTLAYGFLLSPTGTIETDMYVVNTGDRLVCFVAPGTATAITETWSERTFIQDVDIHNLTEDVVCFGVHGPSGPPMLESILHQGDIPSQPLRLDRGGIRDAGVTVCRIDDPTGEPGYLVVADRSDAGAVFDALVNLGAVAAPFGYETWLALTLEAGTPLFETELSGNQPNVCGLLESGVDLDKGCFVGQEPVARVANLATVREQLVGLRGPEHFDGIVEDGDRTVGKITRAAYSPIREEIVAMALVDADVDDELTVEGQTVTRTALPFVTGSAGSHRVPQYA